MATLENSIASMVNGASEATTEQDLEGKYILLYDANGQVVGKVAATLFAFMGSSAESEM